MTKKRKPTKRWTVHEWSHIASGETLRIYYDKDDQVFWTRIATEWIEEKTQNEAFKKAEDSADRLLVSEDQWERFIVVHASKHHIQIGRNMLGHRLQSHDSPLVGFSMARIWLRRGTDGHLYTRDWKRTDCKKQQNFWDVIKLYRDHILDEDETRIPYNDSTWEKLINLSKRLGDVQVTMDEIMKNKELLLKNPDNILGIMGKTK